MSRRISHKRRFSHLGGEGWGGGLKELKYGVSFNLPLSQRSPAQPPEHTHWLLIQDAPFWQFFVHFPKRNRSIHKTQQYTVTWTVPKSIVICPHGQFFPLLARTLIKKAEVFNPYIDAIPVSVETNSFSSFV